MLDWLKPKTKKFPGVNIREVWDFRLSYACPYLFNQGETWVVKLIANDSPDNKSNVLAEYDTGVPTSESGRKGIRACYNWLHRVRDDFSRDHIELRKPVVKLINDSNKHISDKIAHADTQERMGFTREARQIRADSQAKLKDLNLKVKEAVSEMQRIIENDSL